MNFETSRTGLKRAVSKINWAVVAAAAAQFATIARGGRVAAVAGLLLGGHTLGLSAVIDTWTGGSTVSANWSDPANWSSGRPEGGDLVFGPFNQRTTNFDDLGVGFNQQLAIKSLTFTPGAASFTNLALSVT